jgi:creatinine amidohydrolase
MRLADLTSARLEELRPRRPVALWPLGALEPHGPHAPLGTDTLISVGMCERAAARLADPPAVVLPPLPFGVTRYGAAFAGAVGIS